MAASICISTKCEKQDTAWNARHIGKTSKKAEAGQAEARSTHAYVSSHMSACVLFRHRLNDRAQASMQMSHCICLHSSNCQFQSHCRLHNSHEAQEALDMRIHAQCACAPSRDLQNCRTSTNTCIHIRAGKWTATALSHLTCYSMQTSSHIQKRRHKHKDECLHKQ